MKGVLQKLGQKVYGLPVGITFILWLILWSYKLAAKAHHSCRNEHLADLSLPLASQQMLSRQSKEQHPASAQNIKLS